MDEERVISPKLDSNINVMQSVIFTDAKYDMTRTELQILLVIVAAAQQDLREMISSGNYTPPKYDRNILVKFSLRDFPIDMNRNEHLLYKAAKNLVGQSIETKTKTGWEVQTLISAVRYNRKESSVTLVVLPEMWEKILSVDLGYSEYQILTALSIKSKYGVRLYMVINGIPRPKEYTIEELKSMFKLEERYSRPADFINRIIIPAKRDLDKNAPVSFDFKPVRKEGGKKITGLLLSPKAINANKSVEAERQKLLHGKIQVGMTLDHEEIDWLKRHFNFSSVELNSNFGTFHKAKKVFQDGLLDEMASIYEYMIRNGRGGQKGYFIKALKENSSLENVNNVGEQSESGVTIQGQLF